MHRRLQSLLAQGVAHLLERLDRISLPVTAVSGEHQMGPRSLTVRMRECELLGECTDLTVVAERQLCLDQILDGSHAEFLERCDRAGDLPLVGHTTKGATVPHVCGALQQVGRGSKIAAFQRCATRRDELPRLDGVDLRWKSCQAVAARHGLESARQRLHGLADIGDEATKDWRAVWGGLSPHTAAIRSSRSTRGGALSAKWASTAR
jgi:hypothetical protein